MATDASTPKTLDTLNSLLRGELSAIETYEQAIKKCGDDPISELEDNRQCHRARVPVLTSRIEQLGGTPSTSSGAWGAFANLAEGGAKLFGRQAAISMIEEGEDHGLKEYRESFEHLDRDSANIVRRDLMPAQERTHRRMSLLKTQMKSDTRA